MQRAVWPSHRELVYQEGGPGLISNATKDRRERRESKRDGRGRRGGRERRRKETCLRLQNLSS